MAAHTGQPYSATGMAMTMPAAPIIEPIDRSNSPPIISSAAATARMPSCAETSSQLTTPRKLRKPESPATTAKKIKTKTAPATAPSSGRLRSLRQGLTARRRSSRVTGVVMMLLGTGFVGGG